ncbi:MAG: class I SAM-dependent methyltransferase [Clostridiaceae bacterium]
MKYVSGVNELLRFIVIGLFPEGGDTAMDMTLGNGHDTDFLSGIFKNVVALEIQKEAVDKYIPPENVRVYNMDHGEAGVLDVKPDLVVYNLGYLPGGEKTITTKAETTIKSLDAVLKMMNSGGFVVITLYYSHDNGLEAGKVLEYVRNLPLMFGVMHHQFINRGNEPPSLIVIEKR